MTEIARTVLENGEVWFGLFGTSEVVKWVREQDPSLAKWSARIGEQYYLYLPEDIYLLAKLRFPNA